MKVEKSPSIELILAFIEKHLRTRSFRLAASEALSIALIILVRTTQDLEKALARSLAQRVQDARDMLVGTTAVKFIE